MTSAAMLEQQPAKPLTAVKAAVLSQLDRFELVFHHETYTDEFSL